MSKSGGTLYIGFPPLQILGGRVPPPSPKVYASDYNDVIVITHRVCRQHCRSCYIAGGIQICVITRLDVELSRRNTVTPTDGRRWTRPHIQQWNVRPPGSESLERYDDVARSAPQQQRQRQTIDAICIDIEFDVLACSATSRQRSIGDRLATTSRRRQETTNRLPRGVGRQRHPFLLSNFYPNRFPPVIWLVFWFDGL